MMKKIKLILTTCLLSLATATFATSSLMSFKMRDSVCGKPPQAISPTWCGCYANELRLGCLSKGYGPDTCQDNIIYDSIHELVQAYGVAGFCQVAGAEDESECEADISAYVHECHG